MKKILILGIPGAGKSTIARKMAKEKNLPLIHLDKHYWQPGWQETSPEDWVKKVDEFLKEDSWVMDGNYLESLEKRIQASDTIIHLKVGRVKALLRVLKRSLFHLNQTRPDLNEACPERISFSFLKYICQFPEKQEKRIEELLKKYDTSKRILENP